MRSKNIAKHLRSPILGLALALAMGGSMTGCSSNGSNDQALAVQNQEKERLQSENQELAQAAADNQEVQRLTKENQDLPKVRSQYQEAARLRKDNEQLRQQIAKISPPSAGSLPTPGAGDGGSITGQGTNAVAGQTDTPKELVRDDGTIHEGDEIMVDPKTLKQLLPDFDWDKLDRKDPLGVRSLLEKDGVQITNALQLNELGLTNFIIRRAPAAQPQTPQPH